MTAKNSEPRVYIIVLNWNNAADSIACLASIFKLTAGNFQVIVCDNASTDDSIARITSWLASEKHAVVELAEAAIQGITEPVAAEVVVISNEVNYGYAGGNNRGLRYAMSVGGDQDFAWIVNNDTEFDVNALTALRAAATTRPEVSFFGSTILDFHQRDLIQTLGGDQFYPWFGMSHNIGRGLKLDAPLSPAEVESRMGYVVGASVFVRLNAVRKLGLMEEKYFLYFEELDWATRARKIGLRLGYVPESLVYHKEGGTIGTSVFARRKSLLADYYGVKNRIVMTRKLFPWALPTVYLAMFFTLAKRLLTGQLDRAWMVITIMLGIDRRPN